VVETLIVSTPGVRSGKDCIAGTRITVDDVLCYMVSGMADAEILRDFPDLRPEHLEAVRRRHQASAVGRGRAGR